MLTAVPGSIARDKAPARAGTRCRAADLPARPCNSDWQRGIADSGRRDPRHPPPPPCQFPPGRAGGGGALHELPLLAIENRQGRGQSGPRPALPAVVDRRIRWSCLYRMRGAGAVSLGSVATLTATRCKRLDSRPPGSVHPGTAAERVRGAAAKDAFEGFVDTEWSDNHFSDGTIETSATSDSTTISLRHLSNAPCSDPTGGGREPTQAWGDLS